MIVQDEQRTSPPAPPGVSNNGAGNGGQPPRFNWPMVGTVLVVWVALLFIAILAKIKAVVTLLPIIYILFCFVKFLEQGR